MNAASTHHLGRPPARRAAGRAAAGFAALIALLTTACSGDSGDDTASSGGDPTDVRRFDGETLTVAGYSSTFNDVWAESFGAYFEERTGVTVEWLESSPQQAISRIRAAGGSPDIDMMLLDTANLAQAVQADAVAEVDTGLVPNLDDVPDALRIDQGIPTMLYRYGSCYRADTFTDLGLAAPTTPDSWFDPRLAGHVMLPGSTASQWLITAPAFAQSLGFAVDDAEGTADRLAELDPYGFFNASGDVDSAMTAGDVWLTLGNVQGRCLALKQQGVPVEYAGWEMDVDGQQYTDLLNPDNIVLVNGTEKAEVAALFMNEYLSAEAAAATVPLWQFIAGTPPTEAALDELSADPAAADWLIADPSALFTPDYQAFLPSLADWNTAWNGLLS
ncbi:extracellular solute-binding protein [Jiangella asiatica]|uniref:Extracellular solute-binding protein n=1 Tax=Jiangella asiatica TaxID=2530372 RepID=A0A4R5DUN0_9ACTN|nr:extracellular solute-binding protein [Jiangella asiatica]TDE15851.1 extracellular solute-binding protein [Jiangella asiatica]